MRPACHHLPLALALVASAGAAFAQAYTVQPVSDADTLASVMRRVAASPLDATALTTAAELSLKVGDTAAAAALFARADKVYPRNPRVKAGMATLLVRSERPGEALRYFAQAEAYGLSARSMAAERGLAYDLIGEQERAQRDYRLALRFVTDDETVRRYALSLGISGKRDAALEQLELLVRRGDRGAWRARAFVLAMGGDYTEASKIATTMMPAGMAAGLAGFFRRLPTLPAIDRAFAVHFGAVGATAARLADARQTPVLSPLTPEAGVPVMLARAAPAPVAVKEDRRGRRERRDRDRDRDRRVRSGRVALAAAPTPAPARVALPPPPAYRPPAYSPPGFPPVALAQTNTRPLGFVAPAPRAAPSWTMVGSAIPLRANPIGERIDTASFAARPSFSANPPARAGVSNPPVASSLAAIAALLPRAATTTTTTSQGGAGLLASAPVSLVTSPFRSVVPSTSGGFVGAPTPGLTIAAAPSPRAFTAPVASVARNPVPGAVAGDRIAVSARPMIAGPVRTAQAGPVTGFAPSRAAAPSPGIVPVAVTSPAPGFSSTGLTATASRPAPLIASARAALPVATTIAAPALPAAPPRSGADSILARIVANISIPATELGIAAVGAAPAPRPALIAAKSVVESQVPAKPTAAERRAAERKVLADKKAIADKKAVADKKVLAAKEEAEAKKAARADLPRIWVQVAGGASEGDLPKAWAAAKSKAPALAGRQAWTTPLRATNRVLTGPFKTEAEARAVINQLAKQGVSAFSFTSAVGQKVTRLAAK